MQGQETIIDATWVEPTPAETDCLICPVCYKLIRSPSGAVECTQCHRLICAEDHHNISQVKSSCPICKLSPWKTAQHLHPLYQQLIDSLSYHCQQCKDGNSFQRQELERHLESAHRCLIEQPRQFYEYFCELEDGAIIVLSAFQNSYANHMRQINRTRFSIGIKNFSSMEFDLHRNIGLHTGRGKFKLIWKKGKDLMKGERQGIWEVQFQKGPMMFEESLQEVLERGYQKSLVNAVKSEIMIDIEDTRYRVSFQKMNQTNTHTGFKRTINRLDL